ncbi:hypothetical protein FE257_011573 [Aspergillus nanangensis]|uniref:25S rRNA (Uridine(2843)-N(3))-methyltransferase n=1 Tax=Aspergillus nanangensis TaxID=2582783 RepID=A0AAD4CH04_ASPNN|nr:hypothetical protein FE257_011573 [Aspergillus nanangensis]
MGPPRSSNSRSNPKDSKKDKKKPVQSSHRPAQSKPPAPSKPVEIDLSATIPPTLQQLLLNVFKTGLLSADGLGWNQEHAHYNNTNPSVSGETTAQPQENPLDIKGLIQTIKSHLYNRDFDSAFTDASDDLLCAYALRWSASRALGYAGIFKALGKSLLGETPTTPSGSSSVSPDSEGVSSSPSASTRHVICIGGGAGAEIVALAAVWRDLLETQTSQLPATNHDKEDKYTDTDTDKNALSEELASVSLQTTKTHDPTKLTPSQPQPCNLAITAVDIADWSRVVDRLAFAIRSPRVPGSRTHPTPLLQRQPGTTSSEGQEEDEQISDFAVRFRRADVLSISDAELKRLFRFDTTSTTALVTLMFTLNELFSTSMAKTTAFLLRTTDLLQPGALLLVVDSPGSYSTLKLGKTTAEAGDVAEEGDLSAVKERRYPMKFLLDHTLLSVATGKWERVLSQDSRWWRRDAARLGYDVGEGAGLEDMRFQVHIYRRVEG